MANAEEQPPDFEKKRELFRLTFARWDIKLAKNLCSWLLDPKHPTGSDIYTALWTSMAVCYARPFSKNNIGRLAKQWGRFEDDQLRRTHEALTGARDRDFAHTDKSPGRAVYVYPPGSMGERGTATVGVVPWGKEVVAEAVTLCQHQIERLGVRIEELVGELYGDEEWPEGTQLPLDYPEQCSFCGRILEKAVAGAGRPKPRLHLLGLHPRGGAAATRRGLAGLVRRPRPCARRLARRGFVQANLGGGRGTVSDPVCDVDSQLARPWMFPRQSADVRTHRSI